jgi:hypothetical protein
MGSGEDVVIRNLYSLFNVNIIKRIKINTLRWVERML